MFTTKQKWCIHTRAGALAGRTHDLRKWWLKSMVASAMPMLFIVPQSLMGQYVYTVSGTLETQQFDPIGLDGATMSLQLEFDDPDVWGQPVAAPGHAVTFEASVRAASGKMNISGATNDDSNGIFVCNNQPFYSYGQFDPTGPPEIPDDEGWVTAKFDSFLEGDFDVVFRGTGVHGLQGVQPGSSLELDDFVPAQYPGFNGIYNFENFTYFIPSPDGGSLSYDYRFITGTVTISAMKVPEPSCSLALMMGIIVWLSSLRKQIR